VVANSWANTLGFLSDDNAVFLPRLSHLVERIRVYGSILDRWVSLSYYNSYPPTTHWPFNPFSPPLKPPLLNPHTYPLPTLKITKFP
jgi:hypothetical protein